MRSIAVAVLIVLRSVCVSADGQTPNRTRWEYHDGALQLARSWEETRGTTSHKLVETARNPVYVELFDPARDYFLRLYPDKLLLRGGNATAKRFAKFTRLYKGSWKDGARRLNWEYAGGSLRAQPATTWVEKNVDGLRLFAEERRTDNFIELFDRQREFTLRLYPQELQIRGGNDSVRTRFPKFTRLYAGGWAPVAKPAQLAVKLDVRDAPETAAWAADAKQLCETWYAIVFDRLYPGRRPPKRTITIIFKGPSMKGLAFTQASVSTVTISADWIKKHPDDFGMVIHELTHIVQNYPRSKGSNPFWVQEGMADYFRYYEYEPEKGVPVNWKKTYRDGYAIASAFLDWIQRTHEPRIIEKVNTRLTIGEYTDELFADFAGAPLEQLWTEFLAAEQPKRAPERPR
jgi:hypothetical protein